MNLSVMYRGPLTSCNYSCHYCPFAKRHESPERLLRDQTSLLHFVAWVHRQPAHRLRILFTPWGEALVRAWYREALILISHVEHVETVAVQTNLSCGLEWIERCRLDRLALWATFHPTEVDQDLFVSRVHRLVLLGVALSVGVVAVPNCLRFVKELRAALPSAVYLWINAQQPRSKRYTPEEIEQLTAIDPQFPLSLRRSSSKDRWCLAGETSFAVDGDGVMHRCHFVDEPIGNINDPNWELALRPRRCPNSFCTCFLGKTQLEHESVQSFFGDFAILRQPSAPAIADEYKVTR